MMRDTEVLLATETHRKTRKEGVAQTETCCLAVDFFRILPCVAVAKNDFSKMPVATP